MSSGSRTVYKQSNLPYQISYSSGSSIMYTYDSNGNITQINTGGVVTTYAYDKLNRLTYENNPALKSTYYYTYDSNGNILSKKTVSSLDGETYIDSYTYTNGKLTNDGRGNSIVYDAIGNPTKYRGNSLTWEKGKRLIKFGSTTFGYDGRGRRIKKNSVRYYYDYADRLVASSDGMEYFYDHMGVAGFKYNGVCYIYKRDAQNNVTAILDNTGKTVVEYTYNAWGYHTVSGSLASTVGEKNPFRYRSYFYDTETKLYFLKTRYYDPLIGRFLNMDSISYADPEAINGLNLYAYCGNNPVMNIDPNGNSFTGIFVQAFVSLWSYAGIAVASIFDKEVRQDMNNINWNPFNTDELKVIGSNKVSFYKGVPVIQINTSIKRSGTFLAIFLQKGSNVDTIKHEFGHIPQQMFLGPIKYGLFVGIPSATKMGSWSNNNNYYGAPWETMADMFGKSSRTHTSKEQNMAIAHLTIAAMAGPLSFIFAFF